MLCVNTTVVAKIKDKINGLTLDGITYRTGKIVGLVLHVKHDGNDDEKAKTLLKNYLVKLPEVGPRFLNVRIADDQGNYI